MNDTQEIDDISREKEIPAQLPDQPMGADASPDELEMVTEEDEEDTDAADEVIEAGEFSTPKENAKEEEEEVQRPHSRHHEPPVATIDHRLLAGKLGVFNWLGDLPSTGKIPEIVEVRFKNTRKGFYTNPSQIPLKEGDIVAVEAALGHDIGVVSLVGELVKEQMRLKKVDVERNPLKKVYRKAKPHDIEKWQQAIALEHDTMIRSRKIAADLHLNMKIGDVEYQGDKTKAIFYYIADDRVDFRTLIKVLAETFRIRIEMKQIGTRQEAGRIGGIGPCGRKLCCSTFITNFVSVSTSAARYQDISLNPQKLAGQCGKLKCCLNFEVDAYVDAQKDFPSANITLNTGDGLLYHQKSDIFGRVMTYSPDKEGKGIFIQIPVSRVKEIIAMNKKGVIPPKAVEEGGDRQENIGYTDGVGEESLNRFDEKKKTRKRNRNKNGGGKNNTVTRENAETNVGDNVRKETAQNVSARQEQNPGQRNNRRPGQRREQRQNSRPKSENEQNRQPKIEQ